MQRLEISGAVRLIYRSLGVKGLIYWCFTECINNYVKEVNEKEETLVVLVIDQLNAQILVL